MIRIEGQLMGERVPTDAALEGELVVRVTAATGEAGPVADSMIMVAGSGDGTPRARYLSWIVGYADLDEASAAEPGRWNLVEPSALYAGQVSWQPYGWGPLEQVWTHPPPAERLRSYALNNGVGNVSGDDLSSWIGPPDDAPTAPEEPA